MLRYFYISIKLNLTDKANSKNKSQKHLRLMCLMLIILCLFACKPVNKNQKLHIIHAGSFSLIMKEVIENYKSENPEIQITTEAWGSKDGARQITELKKSCDVFISADNKIIEEFLIPDYAKWSIPFAGNEIVLAYTGKSKFSENISTDNWYELLNESDVLTARSSPDSDPCGVRAVLMLKLSDNFYKKDISTKLLSKDVNFMRPKESDLIALLEKQAVDYLYIYKSIAVQHNFKYIELPDQVNLSNPDLGDVYAKVSCSTAGKKPGTVYTEKGTPIVYGITIPSTATNSAGAEDFIAYMLNAEKGGKAILKNGQNLLAPQKVKSYNEVPEKLKSFVLE